MAQTPSDISNAYYYDDYKSFIEQIKSDTDFARSLINKEGVYIKNLNVVLHLPLRIGGNLPENGLMFEYMNLITSISGLKQLHLVNLFIKDLPNEMANLKNLTNLEICFTRNADIKKNLEILRRLPALKRLDLNGSRISMKQRDFIRNELAKTGVIVNDFIFLSD